MPRALLIFYMRPVEGITILADFDEMRIVQYKDRSVSQKPRGRITDQGIGGSRTGRGGRAAGDGPLIRDQRQYGQISDSLHIVDYEHANLHATFTLLVFR